ncbi:MAG: hypothetical protein V4439_00080 [Patescibacteria group bacterium]
MSEQLGMSNNSKPLEKSNDLSFDPFNLNLAPIQIGTSQVNGNKLFQDHVVIAYRMLASGDKKITYKSIVEKIIELYHYPNDKLLHDSIGKIFSKLDLDTNKVLRYNDLEDKFKPFS